MLRLWDVCGEGDYCRGSFLVAAESRRQANKIINNIKKEHERLTEWGVEIQPGQITGVEPGIIHSFWYYE